jgi:hypothetical protein
MRRIVPTFLILTSLFLLLPNSASQDVFVTVEGPDVMPIGGVFPFNITAVGGPAGEVGTYNISAFLLGSNLTGADPSPGNVFMNMSADPHWTVNVTVPNDPQTMTLVVNVTSDYENESDFKETRHQIKVVRPTVLSAEISNPLDYELREIPVDFYVRAPGESEDRLLGTVLIESMAPGEKEFASFDWVVADPSPGRYRLTVVIDLDRDGVINEEAGDSMAVSHFYVGGGVGLLSYLLAVLFILFIILSAFWLLRKPTRRKG